MNPVAAPSVHSAMSLIANTVTTADTHIFSDQYHNIPIHINHAIVFSSVYIYHSVYVPNCTHVHT